jgi:pimeloyl-ACP methyl ester carboxylesterase
MNPRSAHHIDIPTAKLRVFAAGRGKPVLLLHGGGADSALLSWGAVFDAVAEHARVFAPDWPGYGGSDPVHGVLTGELLVRVVEELRAELDLETVVLAGISLGGETSIGYALAHPRRVESMVLIGSGGMQRRAPYHALAWPMLHLPVIGRVMARAQWRLLERSRSLLGVSLKALLPSWEEIPDPLVDLIRAELDSRANPDVFFEWQRDEVRPGGLKTDYTPRLPQLRMPVTLLHGDRDIAVPVKNARRAAELIPTCDYHEYPGCGHWLPRERPDEVARRIVEAVKG